MNSWLDRELKVLKKLDRNLILTDLHFIFSK